MIKLDQIKQEKEKVRLKEINYINSSSDFIELTSVDILCLIVNIDEEKIYMDDKLEERYMLAIRKGQKKTLKKVELELFFNSVEKFKMSENNNKLAYAILKLKLTINKNMEKTQNPFIEINERSKILDDTSKLMNIEYDIFNDNLIENCEINQIEDDEIEKNILWKTVERQ